MKSATPAESGNHGGAIVNISSISSQIAQPGFVPYSMTKGAMAQMTRNQAVRPPPAFLLVACELIVKKSTSQHLFWSCSWT